MEQMNETARTRALLLAARNQMDWLWHLADRQGGGDRQRIEGVLKLIGAIDYALGIEPYTLDDLAPGASYEADAGNSRPNAARPLDVGGMD